MDVKPNTAPGDLLGPIAEAADRDSPESPNGAGRGRGATGILPLQELEHLVRTSKEIVGVEPIQDDQFQPASLDLRLGATAYRVRASFLPGADATVAEKVENLTMHSMDITHGGVLERGCVYIIPLLETLALKYRMSAVGNPKSSTGRLDVFTRLITDHGTQFDRVPEQYRGPLYAEVSPRTFSILVRKGSRLSQLRIRRGSPPVSDPQMRALQREHGLVGALTEHDIENGVPVTVDVAGHRTHGLIGYRAKSHAGLIDVDRLRHYDVADFWDEVRAPRRGGLVLDPEDFYILASREPVKVPDTHAAEMVAYDTLVGEFRVHYAGFFDPGFGMADAAGAGARAVLEVRSFEVPFVIEDNQVVGRLMYERLTARPAKLYGSAANSYQGQGIALSKHFR